MRPRQLPRSLISKAGPPASIGEHHFFSIVTFIADRNYEGRPEEAIMARWVYVKTGNGRMVS
ncbi:MAG: hypothetical protein QF498_06500 [Arenicellales bacterium]|jgi:hypothetical protein|nr:hypothetical protein [Arenicellales bacterium]